ncbi:MULTISPECIES: thioesterase II family protein [unclassified Nocardia]|uniref:thioesterase II family protein n=1 Tax=unclassified Nocardia TaxID=2637762 RepID=UPI001CE474FD|nr:MULTISPECIES: alpha/beta fold hydrolase [unclassified Nocardia]
MTATDPSLFRVYRPQPAARLRLVFFPHAGGSASFYRGWAEYLPESVELAIAMYPGREDRLFDSHPDTLEELAAGFACALPQGIPLVLYGHSMGAAVAYEVARRAAHRPEQLIVSGQPAPNRQRPNDVHLRDDAGLVDELRGLGGATTLLDHPEIRELMLPMIRSDYRLIETYRPNSPAPLDIPVVAVIGDADPEVDADEAGAWRDHTVSGFELHTVPGGHFQIVERADAFIGWLSALLMTSHLLWPSTP